MKSNCFVKMRGFDSYSIYLYLIPAAACKPVGAALVGIFERFWEVLGSFERVFGVPLMQSTPMGAALVGILRGFGKF